jgi:hypothetical protein
MTATPRIYRSAEWAVLTVGILSRLYLAFVNREANDDHLTVIRMIARDHRLPRLRDAWEGFQPKLYHVTVAILSEMSPWQSRTALILIAQLVACAAGVATLFVLRRAMERWEIRTEVRLVVFALVALNPVLIGLNAQATNDSFVILFATIAVAAGCDFFRSGMKSAFLIMSVSTVLAALSKGNGLVVFVAVMGVFGVSVVGGRAVPRLTRPQLVGLMLCFVTGFVALTATLGSYRANWQDTGNPLAINGPPAPLPNLFTPTYVYRPGVTSVASAYLTFRFAGILRYPVITNDAADYPLHRTSVWSQLYGRAHFVRFSQHPPSWRNTGPVILSLGRLTLVLALLPTLLMLLGTMRGLAALTAWGRRRQRGLELPLGHYLFALVALGYGAFIILYTLRYRDFATMKAEFLFPGLAAYLFFLATELERIMVRGESMPWLRAGVISVTGALCVAYITDTVLLAAQLT